MIDKKWMVPCIILTALLAVTTVQAAPPPDDPSPPAEAVKLIFIHHSTGGNWLADPNSDQPYGGLGKALMDNNYFVSATNYGWGPDSIGDRTDIVNWPEWFTGPQRDAYLDALYNENGQNFGDFGSWPRMASDPGGENAIVMFKSCFPNSDLYGNPGDPPYAEPNDWEEYSVSNAKAIYNDLLTYFETRQDKLFVVITAPPLIESETESDRAANARAFNNWLVSDWLTGYPYANVAVFDYYNTLTAQDNHHRWTGTGIEHVQPVDDNFSAYPSGDSHPSTAGHQKASAEFVPLLNVYYNRWQAGVVAPPPPPPAEQPTEQPPDAEATSPPPDSPSAPSATGAIDDFESDVHWDTSAETGSTIACDPDTGTVHSGASALHIHYEIASDGWADCGRYFDPIRDWSGSTGLAFWLRADGTPEWATLVIFSGAPDGPTPFEIDLEITEQDWTQVTLPWNGFTRAEWADDSGLDEIDPARITGYGFSLGSGTGDLWVDDVTLVTGEIQPQPELVEEEVAEEAVEPTPAESEAEDTSSGGPCPSAALALALGAVGIVLARRRSNHE